MNTDGCLARVKVEPERSEEIPMRPHYSGLSGAQGTDWVIGRSPIDKKIGYYFTDIDIWLSKPKADALFITTVLK